MTEEREEMEEESPEVVVVVVVVDDEDGMDSPLKLEVGGEVEVTERREGTEVVLFKQEVDEPALTVIAGESLPSPLESWRTMTTVSPAAIAA